MSAQILLHPKLPHRVPLGEVVRRFEQLGYSLSNTAHNNIEAQPIKPRRSIVQSIFDFARRPQ